MTCNEGAGSRTRLDHSDGEGTGNSGADHAAIRQHDKWFPLEPHLLQAINQGVQIRACRRHGIGIDRRGAGAQIFAHLRCNVTRQCHDDFRCHVVQQCFQPALVVRITIAIQQAHSDRFNPLGCQFCCEYLNLLCRNRSPNRSVSVAAFIDAPGEFARDQRLRVFQLRIEHVVSMLVAYVQDIAKALGSDQAGHRALALNQYVRHDRSCVGHNVVDVPQIDTGFSQYQVRRTKKTVKQIVVCGQRLVGPALAIAGNEHSIGKRTADVDRECVTGHPAAGPR